MELLEASLPVWASDKFCRDFRRITLKSKEIVELVQSKARQNFETFKNDNSVKAIFEKHLRERGNVLLCVAIYWYFWRLKSLAYEKDAQEAIKAFDAALRLAEEERELIAYHYCLQIVAGHLLEASKANSLFRSNWTMFFT